MVAFTHLLISLLLSIPTSKSRLYANYYSKSCPKFDQIMQETTINGAFHLQTVEACSPSLMPLPLPGSSSSPSPSSSQFPSLFFHSRTIRVATALLLQLPSFTGGASDGGGGMWFTRCSVISHLNNRHCWLLFQPEVVCLDYCSSSPPLSCSPRKHCCSSWCLLLPDLRNDVEDNRRGLLSLTPSFLLLPHPFLPSLVPSFPFFFLYFCHYSHLLLPLHLINIKHAHIIITSPFHA